MSARSQVIADDRRSESLQFWAIFAVSFPVFLTAAVSHRLSPNHWRGVSAAHRSIFAEAWEASGTTARMAFAG